MEIDRGVLEPREATHERYAASVQRIVALFVDRIAVLERVRRAAKEVDDWGYSPDAVPAETKDWEELRAALAAADATLVKEAE